MSPQGSQLYNPSVEGSPLVMLDPYRLPKAYRGLARDYFSLGTDFLPLTASVALTRDIQVNEDAAFVIVAAVAVVTDTLNTTRLTFIPQLVMLQEGSAQRNLFNQETHFHNIYGTAEEPAYWPNPKVLPRASTFSIQHRNLEAIDRNVRVLFIGFKVFGVEDE